MADEDIFAGIGQTRLPLWPKRNQRTAGAVDHIAPDEGIFGWVIDTGAPGEQVHVQIVCGDEVIADGATGIPRPDVVTALSVSGEPGFMIPWEAMDSLQIERIIDEDPDASFDAYVPSVNGRLQKSPENKTLLAISMKDVLTFIESSHEKREKARLEAEALRRKNLMFELNGSTSAQTVGAPQQPVVSIQIDTIIASRAGTALVVGWIDDRDNPMTRLHVFADLDPALDPTAFGRVRRPDVDSALQAHNHLFGFWAVLNVARPLSPDDKWMVRGDLTRGHSETATAGAKILTDTALRTTILEYFASTEYYGSRHIESYIALEAGIGKALVGLNRRITNGIVAGAWVSYYGPNRASYLGSIIVCLFGKHEFMFIQSALFSMGKRAHEYEYVYVSNSPELTETLEKEARLCARIYGISIVLVCLPDNAGFGAANNVAAKYARSSRLMITNPDVFPRNNDWAWRHQEIIEQAPREQTAMFGVPLHYDDGSLMHHGIYFEVDAGISVRNDGVFSRPMIRTEHYAKGAPIWARFAAPRPVPAVTGAFISAERGWFEALGGFTEDYLFGHYEDCDLCLKSYSRGKPVWVQDLPLWHMEGKGSTRRHAHEGGILVNRWVFTKAWGELIARDLNGPAPQILADMAPAPAEPGQAPVMHLINDGQDNAPARRVS
jgi:GT2 family glycosyltransferase